MKTSPRNAVFGLAALSLSLWAACAGPASATELPPGVTAYLRSKDPLVQVRFDGLATMSNGERYLPVLPQTFSQPGVRPESLDPKSVTSTLPAGAAFPDIVEFDNGVYLLRLMPTSTGKWTLPRLADYPLALKSGLLPQDLVLPNGLSIPAELKVILGSLPYQAPSVKPMAGTPAPLPPTATKNPSTAPATPAASMLYIAELSSQRLLGFSPSKPGLKPTSEIPLGCVPASLEATPSGDRLLVTCLGSDQVALVDPQAGLVRTRMSVGARPTATVALLDSGQVLVSNRYARFLSLVDPNDPENVTEVQLPGNGGVMSALPGLRRVFVADAVLPRVYLVDLQTQLSAQTFPAIPNLSALWVSPPRPVVGRGSDPVSSPYLGRQLWMASRTTHTVAAVDLDTGEVIRAFEVGKKPVALAAHGEWLYVLCAEDNRIDLIRWTRPFEQTETPDPANTGEAAGPPVPADIKKTPAPRGTPVASILLEPGSFPSGLALSGDGQFAYVSSAGTDRWQLVNLAYRRLESTFEQGGRGVAVVLLDPSRNRAQEAAAEAALVQQEATARQAEARLERDRQTRARKPFFNRLLKGPETPTASTSPTTRPTELEPPPVE